MRWGSFSGLASPSPRTDSVGSSAIEYELPIAIEHHGPTHSTIAALT